MSSTTAGEKASEARNRYIAEVLKKGAEKPSAEKSRHISSNSHDPGLKKGVALMLITILMQ